MRSPQGTPHQAFPHASIDTHEWRGRSAKSAHRDQVQGRELRVRCFDRVLQDFTFFFRKPR
jgi:hypothetical protein